MIKARFSERQPSVEFSKIADKYYIFICLNEEKKTDQNSRRNKKKDGMGYHQLFL